MDELELLRATLANLADRAGRLVADCAVKDAAIADLRRQLKELDDGHRSEA